MGATMKTVRVFIGNKEEMLTLYERISRYLDVDMCYVRDMCELRASTQDYVKAFSLGSSVIRTNGVKNVACVLPCGTITVCGKDLSSEVVKNVSIGTMPVFTGVSIESIARVKNRLESVGIDSAVKKSKIYDWQLVVNPNDYFEAVSIGAKFIDGNEIKQVYWNDVAGDIRFNIDRLAQNARTELDEILEA